MHLGCAEDYTEQLLKFFDFGIVGRSSIELNHASDNIRWVVPFEILLDVLFMFDWVGNRVEIPLLVFVGAHSVHQALHHVSRLPPGGKAPFTSALLHSNAIV